MIKRLLQSLALLALTALLCGCGGGSGSSQTPTGVNPGLPSIVKLMPVKQVAQTNSTVDLTTKVLDGNGEPVPNVEVVYTNLSTLGVLSSTKARTNSLGLATVFIFSSDVGFATIQAEVSVGSQWVRDRKVVFYSPFDLTLPLGTTTAVATLTLDVDSNGNGIFDEAADFILLHGANNNQSVIRATVKDSSGNLVAGDVVTFTADSTEATFPLGNTGTTGAKGQANFGQASVLMDVSPTILRNVQTILTVSAVSATTSAANLVSFFLDPVTVGTVTVTANPTTVASAATSSITANVVNSAGTPVPDGTTVNFTANKGVVVPFAQTTSGQATATWTAPTVTANTTASVTASAAGKSGSVTINITAPPVTLRVTPTTGSVITGATPTPASLSFTIAGGTGPYIVVSSDPTKVTVPATSAGSLTATIVPNACPGTVTISIYDSVGVRVDATVTIVATPFTVAPLAASFSGGAGTLSVLVSGGVAPYLAASSSPVLTTAFVAGPPPSFTITQASPVLAATSVTVTVSDTCGQSRAVVVSVNP